MNVNQTFLYELERTVTLKHFTAIWQEYFLILNIQNNHVDRCEWRPLELYGTQPYVVALVRKL